MNKKKIRSTIKSIIFYLVVAFLFLYVIINVAAPAKVINIFGFQILPVASESMEPQINKYDLIFITKVKEENLQEGNIITFYTYERGTNSSGQIVYVEIRNTHKIMSIEEQEGKTIYITRGVNPNITSNDTIFDENGQITTLTYDRIIGRYAFHIPYIGWLPIVIQQGINPIFLLLIVANIVIIITLIKVIRKKPEQEKIEDDSKNDVE